MSVTETRPYKVTFILDTRGYDEAVETLGEFLKTTSTELGADVTSLGEATIQEFARTPDQRFTSGHYLEMLVEAAPTFPAALKEKLRLDKRVHRIFVESH